jgi:hypothetical protein
MEMRLGKILFGRLCQESKTFWNIIKTFQVTIYQRRLGIDFRTLYEGRKEPLGTLSRRHCKVSVGSSGKLPTVKTQERIHGFFHEVLEPVETLRFEPWSLSVSQGKNWKLHEMPFPERP